MTTYVTTAPTVSLSYIKNAKAELVDHIPNHAKIVAIARKGCGWPKAVLAKKDGKFYKAIQNGNETHACLFK